jgi:hypothetical protein
VEYRVCVGERLWGSALANPLRHRASKLPIRVPCSPVRGSMLKNIRLDATTSGTLERRRHWTRTAPYSSKGRFSSVRQLAGSELDSGPAK